MFVSVTNFAISSHGVWHKASQSLFVVFMGLLRTMHTSPRLLPSADGGGYWLPVMWFEPVNAVSYELV